jgi:hypothetical protein
MQVCSGRLTEIWLENGHLAGQILCDLQPAPGQYLLAQPQGGTGDALPANLFSAGETAGGFMAAPPLPAEWGPGKELLLRGPIGKGFSLPEGVRRVCLLALDATPSRLLPLAILALKVQAEATLVCNTSSIDLTAHRLPTALEVDTLEVLQAVLAWADFLAIDLPAARLPQLRQQLGIQAGEHLPCAAQVLVFTPMPCAGVADCGACAVKGRRGWRLACKDGPVFDLNDLEW